MAKKKFILRIEEETLRALEQWAAEEFRSVNGQLEWLLTKALKEAGRLPNHPAPRKPEEP
ncbi:MAG: Arc family DNA binding domain-containing protein [Bacteroidetes bacterium]|nr:MAG: Arc family DNA binding domain-containing protein [Bacteroidota bacterium]